MPKVIQQFGNELGLEIRALEDLSISRAIEFGFCCTVNADYEHLRI